MASQLPEGGEWATAPLLDKSNVGKYVWFVWNGNSHMASVQKIVKIGRTNIHVSSQRSKPYSMLVSELGDTAGGTTASGHGVSCHTEQHRLEAGVRRDARSAIEDAVRHAWNVPTHILVEAARLLTDRTLTPMNKPWKVTES